MNSFQKYPFMNPQASFVQPGSVDFVPAWIIMIITVIEISLVFPKFFNHNRKTSQEKGVRIISPVLLFFLFGSLMPIFDDIFAFLFGPPFAHHSVFHSIPGAILTFAIFRILSTERLALHALFGNLYHIFFNFYFDSTTLFFPLTYQQYGLSDLIKVNTYWIKAIHYPIIFFGFIYLMIKTSIQEKRGHNK